MIFNFRHHSKERRFSTCLVCIETHILTFCGPTIQISTYIGRLSFSLQFCCRFSVACFLFLGDHAAVTGAVIIMHDKIIGRRD
ncbi:hypothetical protein METBIDRAFT_200752 [Metschnikowia bicuspidata var. bicuspidata NRRL YB-4993]|uniref:Uncharacterized protein n=1 Tax=Metschnikowia bicuspidata var. bicuspidata NRRL YB-4993 TaxID=869754 RepID=A0A1A0H974_9ASCO|nr:hypothetical protein METBIDRAFT_200752 [Metschnikowia bicuspidata var. bicuspidata NRRL YB-4993]OBA20566.1 hypothetical protein METBIDRAFT_200752 [Metschnikowia bicuspidata var. bicuspidata NRRL YB-4993]